MSYMPETEARCISVKCRKAASCVRHQCPPGGMHPVGDLSIWMVAGSCGYFVPLGHWREPEKSKPGPTVHEPVRGLS